MWEWIVENANLIFLASSGVLFVASFSLLTVTVIMFRKFRRLRKKLILVDAAMSVSCMRTYSSLDFRNIKEGTLKEVYEQIRPILWQKMNEGFFTVPGLSCSKLFCRGKECTFPHVD